jgi:hypothetical protein
MTLKSMEEAKNDVPEETRKRLGRIWDYALKQEEPSTKPVSIGIVSDRLNKAMFKTLGKEVNAKNQCIRLKDVKHIDETHGFGKEKNLAQIPVTKDIFMLIPNVLENFDTVEKGSESVGRKSVKITKHYSDSRVIVADVILEDRNLNITTMYVKSPTAVSPRNAGAPSDSRLSNQRIRHSNSPPDAISGFTESVAMQDNNNIQNFLEKSKNEE